MTCHCDTTTLQAEEPAEATASATQQLAAMEYTSSYVEGLLRVIRATEEATQQWLVTGFLLPRFVANMDSQILAHWRTVESFIHSEYGLEVRIERPTGLTVEGEALFFKTLYDRLDWDAIPDDSNDVGQEELVFRVFVKVSEEEEVQG